MEPNQPPKTENEKLLEAPPEEKLIDPPEEEQLLPEHATEPHSGGIGKKLFLIIGILALILIAISAYLFVLSDERQSDPIGDENAMPGTLLPNNDTSENPQLDETELTPVDDEMQTVCTMDALLCPDGSSVGRQGPDCEFAACPGE